MATEETKPVEREGFERWAERFIEKIAAHNPGQMSRKQVAREAWKASWDAALERAAQLVETRGAARRDMYDLIGDEHAAEIRALKGWE